VNARNIIIKGPIDVNGNKRMFHIIASYEGTDVLQARREPLKGGGIFTEVNVDAEEYRRLAKLHDIPLNAEDAEA